MDPAKKTSLIKRMLEKAMDQGADADTRLDRDRMLQKMSDQELQLTADSVLDPSNNAAIKIIDEKCLEYRIFPDDVGPAKEEF